MDVYQSKAAKLGLVLKKSTNASKKFDVFKDGIKQTAIGATGFKDYEKYKQSDGIAVANKKRENYRARHKDNINVRTRDGKLTAGYLSNKILW